MAAMAGRDHLWAPWRMQMIRAPREDGCFLCRKSREDSDAENLVLERGRTCFCLMNLYPYSNGHLMVAPYRHVGDLTELSDEEVAEIMTVAREWVRDIQAVARPQGFNLGFNQGTAAGAGVADHLHLHVVPRWGGDTNFMTVLAETRVINQSLAETRAELLRARAGR